MAKVKLTPAELAIIRQKAEAASSNSDGRWGVVDNPHTGLWGLCIHDQGDIIARATGRDKKWKISVFNHIAAADPATVLAMVEEIEQLRRMERKWGQMIKNVKDTAPDLETFLSPDAFKINESEAGQ